jgi:hypothetical protein
MSASALHREMNFSKVTHVSKCPVLSRIDLSQNALALEMTSALLKDPGDAVHLRNLADERSSHSSLEMAFRFSISQKQSNKTAQTEGRIKKPGMGRDLISSKQIGPKPTNSLICRFPSWRIVAIYFIACSITWNHDIGTNPSLRITLS